MKNKYLQVYDLLYAHFGPQNWWPAKTQFEVIIGAVLTQNTNWTNVEKALSNLKREGLLHYQGLSSCPTGTLAELIRPSGYYNVKAKRLKNLLAMIEELYGGDLTALFSDSLEIARQNLLEVKGVGPETADSILLYGGNYPIFVIDAYTHRIFSRHNMVAEETDYHSMQELFMDNLPSESSLYNEYHALIVETAKNYCKKKGPLCHLCPLEGFE